MNAHARGLTLWQTLLCGAVFIVVGLAVGWRSLAYEWQFDDLHLVRAYSAHEIAGAFTGTWDPDGVETKGLRPLTLLFNDARTRAFGEWTLGHRVFLLVLFAAYLVGLSAIAARFGARWWVGLVAGVLTLCAKNSYYHFLWIADGIHLVPALFFVGAVWALLAYLDSGIARPAGASAALLLLALAAREDALALYGVAMLLGLAYLWFNGRLLDHYARLVRYGVLLFATFLPFWVWRLAVVPRAPNFRANTAVITQPIRMFRWTVSLAGQQDASQLLFLLGAVVLTISTLSLRQEDRRRSLLWLLVSAVACVPGAVYARTNLLLFPVSFYALFVVSTLAALAGTSRVRLTAAALVLTLAAAVSVRASQLEQLSQHSMSTEKIFHDWFGVYSQWRFASIPPARLARTKASLAALGIVDEHFDSTQFEEQLRAQHRVGFVDDGRPFIPERKFLTP